MTGQGYIASKMIQTHQYVQEPLHPECPFKHFGVLSTLMETLGIFFLATPRSAGLNCPLARVNTNACHSD